MGSECDLGPDRQGQQPLDENVPEAHDNKEHPKPLEPAGGSLPHFESFRSALDAGLLGVWAWDLRSSLMAWSSNLADFHGSPKEKRDGTFSIAPRELPTQDGAGALAAIR